MTQENPVEDLKLRLDFGKQAPELVFAVEQGEEGQEKAVVKGVLNGHRHVDQLIEEIISKVEKIVPAELLSDELKEKLAREFRLVFRYFL